VGKTHDAHSFVEADIQHALAPRHARERLPSQQEMRMRTRPGRATVRESFSPWMVVILSHSLLEVNHENFWFHSFSNPESFSPCFARSSANILAMFGDAFSGTRVYFCQEYKKQKQSLFPAKVNKFDTLPPSTPGREASIRRVTLLQTHRAWRWREIAPRRCPSSRKSGRRSTPSRRAASADPRIGGRLVTIATLNS